LAGRVEGLLVGDALTGKLVRIACAREVAPAGDRLHRLAPHSAVFPGEADVAVVNLLPHRHREHHAQPADEVLLVVAVEDDVWIMRTGAVPA
jgi:hypothetical protein